MEDKELKEKMIRVVQSLVSKKGDLKLFVLNWISESNQWDIVVSADWVDYQKLRDNISDIFLEVKKEFNGQYSLLFSGIHPLTTEEPMVKNITKMMAIPSGVMDLTNVQIGGLLVEKMIIFVSQSNGG